MFAGVFLMLLCTKTTPKLSYGVLQFMHIYPFKKGDKHYETLQDQKLSAISSPAMKKHQGLYLGPVRYHQWIKQPSTPHRGNSIIILLPCVWLTIWSLIWDSCHQNQPKWEGLYGPDRINLKTDNFGVISFWDTMSTDLIIVGDQISHTLDLGKVTLAKSHLQETSRQENTLYAFHEMRICNLPCLSWLWNHYLSVIIEKYINCMSKQ